MLCERMPTPTVLLLTPPLTQLNTPYPATAYLTGFLREQQIPVSQADIGIEMVLTLFSRSGLAAVFTEVRKRGDDLPVEARQMLDAEQAYVSAVDPVVEFLQTRNPALAPHLVSHGFLPQGPRFKGRSRKRMSEQDHATQFATFFLEDLADLVQVTVSPHFAMSRYAEHIARSASSFDRIVESMNADPTLTDRFMLEALWHHIERVQPSLVGLTVPFPGNLYGAFRIAQSIKAQRPDIVVALGGGYANTELRRVSDPRVFDYVDFILLDDGERPLLSLIQYLAGARPKNTLTRTFHRENNRRGLRERYV